MRTHYDDDLDLGELGEELERLYADSDADYKEFMSLLVALQKRPFHPRVDLAVRGLFAITGEILRRRLIGEDKAQRQ